MWLTLSCIFLRIQFSGQLKLERVSERFYLFKNAIEKVAVASKKHKYYLLICLLFELEVALRLELKINHILFSFQKNVPLKEKVACWLFGICVGLHTGFIKIHYFY